MLLRAIKPTVMAGSGFADPSSAKGTSETLAAPIVREQGGIVIAGAGEVPPGSYANTAPPEMGLHGNIHVLMSDLNFG